MKQGKKPGSGSGFTGFKDGQDLHPMKIRKSADAGKPDSANRHGWEIKKLGDVLEYDKNQTYQRRLPYVGLEHIESNTGRFIGSLQPQEVKSSTFKFSPKHVLYGRLRPYLNKVLLPDFDGHCSTEIFPILVKKGLSREFLFYWLTSDSTIKKIDATWTGARMPRANMNQVLDFEFPLPPLSEQQRIVSILDECFAVIDKAKANAEQNLKNARELFESYLQGVFENENWETKTIEAACSEIFAGGDAPKNNFSATPNEKHKIPIYANAVKDKGLYGFTDFARVKKPCVTIAARGSGTGHTELRNEPFLPIVRLIVCIPDTKQMSTEFLKYTIDNLVIQRSGSAIPQLTVPMIKDYKIPVPTIEEQKLLIEKAENLRAKTQKLEAIYHQKLLNLEELKKSVLQKAFKGEL